MTTPDGGTRTALGSWIIRGGALMLFGCALAMLAPASTVTALDDITISPAVAPADADACPALTRIRYPWSSCGEGFALGFREGDYGEPPASQCRLYMRNGMCAATTEAWEQYYLGLKRRIAP